MPEHAFGVGFESASEDKFVLPSWRIFAADFIVILCAETRTILSKLRAGLWHAEWLS